MAQHQQRSHRVRDLLAYIAIGTAVAVLAIALGVYQAKTGGRPGAALKWVGFTIMTVLIFWWLIRAYRPLWPSGKFWKLLALFLLAHVVLGIGLLLRTNVVSLAPFVLVTPAEYFVVSVALSRLLVQPK